MIQTDLIQYAGTVTTAKRASATRISRFQRARGGLRWSGICDVRGAVFFISFGKNFQFQAVADHSQVPVANLTVRAQSSIQLRVSSVKYPRQNRYHNGRIFSSVIRFATRACTSKRKL